MDSDEEDMAAATDENDGVAAGVAFTRKLQNNMIKLNNPYDEVTIVRQKQQRMSAQSNEQQHQQKQLVRNMAGHHGS